MQARNTRFVRDDATDAIGLWEIVPPKPAWAYLRQAEDDEQRAALQLLQGGVRIGGDQGPGLDRASVFCERSARNPCPFSTVEPRYLPPVLRTGLAEGVGGRELTDVPGAGRAQKGRVSIELTQHALQTVVGHPHAVRRRPLAGRREKGQ